MVSPLPERLRKGTLGSIEQQVLSIPETGWNPVDVENGEAMTHWVWVAMVFGGIVVLLALLLRGGGEPLDRDDTGGGDWPGDSHSGHDSGGHHR